jgi:hypothetical protein
VVVLNVFEKRRRKKKKRKRYLATEQKQERSDCGDALVVDLITVEKRAWSIEPFINSVEECM